MLLGNFDQYVILIICCFRSEVYKLFVGGLSPDVGRSELTLYFEQYGSVKEAIVMMDRLTGNSRGFGFVTFHEGDAFQFVLSLEHMILNKRVDVRPAEARNRVLAPLENTVQPTALEQSINTLPPINAGMLTEDQRTSLSGRSYHSMERSSDVFVGSYLTSARPSVSQVDHRFVSYQNQGVSFASTPQFYPPTRSMMTPVVPPVGHSAAPSASMTTMIAPPIPVQGFDFSNSLGNETFPIPSGYGPDPLPVHTTLNYAGIYHRVYNELRCQLLSFRI